MSSRSALLLVNIGQLLTMRSTAHGARRGASLSELGMIEDAAVLCLGGKIVSVGPTKDALRDPWLKKNRKKISEIDCVGRVVPPEYRGRSQEYVDLVCNEMMPAVAKRKLAQFVDVFSERGAFSADETAQIFQAAEKHALAVRAHIGQLSETRLGPLLRYRPASLHHLDP